MAGIDATLELGMTISGTVIGNGADPVGGIQVNASGASGAAPGIAATNGTYLIQGLFPGIYTLSIYTPAGSPYEAGVIESGAVIQGHPPTGSPVDVSSTSAAGVDFSVAVGVVIRGHVSGGDAPVGVDVFEVGGNFGSGSADASASGHYAVRGLWPGSYSIVFVAVTDPTNQALSPFPYGAYANGTLVDQNSAVPVDASAGDITLTSIVIPIGAAMRGTIRADGLPAGHAFVEACDVAGSLGCVTTETGLDGTWTIGHFETGDWLVLASATHHVPGHYGPGGYVPTAAQATPVHVDSAGPSVTGINIALPDGGLIAGTISGPGGVPLAHVQLAPDGGSGASYPGPTPCVTATDGSFSCAGLLAGLYNLYVNAPANQDVLPGYYDAGAAGNYTFDYRQATQFMVTDTNDLVPPSVISLSPGKGVHAIARDATVSVGFSEDIKGSGPKTFQLEVDGSSAILAATYHYDVVTHSATLKPAALLAPATRYRVMLTSGIIDDAGNRLVRTSWTFTTTSDATPPRVIHRTPWPGSVGNIQVAAIRAQFSEQVRGLSGSTFLVVRRSDQQHLRGGVSYDPTTRTATFDYPLGLDPSTQYLVVLEPGITDLAGNPLARNPWTFTWPISTSSSAKRWSPAWPSWNRCWTSHSAA